MMNVCWHSFNDFQHHYESSPTQPSHRGCRLCWGLHRGLSRRADGAEPKGSERSIHCSDSNHRGGTGRDLTSRHVVGARRALIETKAVNNPFTDG